jgi:hypothetical protein
MHLSGREYIVLQSFDDGSKKIQFPTFGNEIVIATKKDLDGSYKENCEKRWKEQQDRIAKEHGWR